MRARLSTAACAMLAVATAVARSSTPAQDPQAPVFRVESDFIRVDMYATRNGEFVPDIRPEDVEILEDGVRQEIRTFELVHIPSGPVSGLASEPDDGEPTFSEDSRSRVFVVFIDTYTTGLAGDSDLRLSLVRFLDRLLAPDDLVGMMTPDMSVQEVRLGRRSTVISDVANDERWWNPRPGGEDLQEFAWQNCYPTRGASGRVAEMKARRDAKLTLDALQDLVEHLRFLREERKAVLMVTGGWPFLDDMASSSSSRVESRSCKEDRAALSRIDYSDLLEDLAKAANRANVSFYPVSSRREQKLPSEMRASMRQYVRQRERRTLNAVNGQLRTLAQDTDGLADLDRSFDRVTTRIIDDTSSYYLLGYQSTNLRQDGRFRTITVKVNRPGVRVRSRRGYGGEPPPVLNAAAPASAAAAVDARVVEALTSVERFDTLAPFWGRLSAWEEVTPGAGMFWFVGELGTEARGEERWAGGATAEVVVIDASKTQVLAQTVTLGPNDATFTVRVPDAGSLAPGDYSVRVRLQAAGEDRSVHDLAQVTLESDAPGLGEAVLLRRGPSLRLDYFRTADPRFRRTEGFRLELPTSSSAPVEARVLDRLGRPLQVPTQVSYRADVSDGFQWVVIDAPLTVLAPADYTIEATQSGTSRFTAFRIVP